jgi:hypothetical protein
MSKVFENINRVLAIWNPIGVDDYMALEEYKAYIPSLLKAIEDKQKLKKCLEEIIVNEIGLGYDPTNKKDSEDLEQVCDNIIQAYRISEGP